MTQEDGPLRHVKLTLIDSVQKAGDFMSWLGQSREVLAFDTETSGLKNHIDRLRLVQIGDADHGWAIPWDYWGGVAMEALTKYDGQLIAHNSKFDVGFLRRHAGWQAPWSRIHDTMTMSHIARPIWPHGLKPLAGMLVDPQAVAAQQLLASGMVDNKWTWGTVPITYEPYWVYAAMDPVLTCRIYEKLKAATFTQFHSVYDLEMAIVRIIGNMEFTGAAVDLDYCHKTRMELNDFVARAKDWARSTYGIENVNSGPQVIKLFHQLGLTSSVFTNSGAESADKYQMRIWKGEGRQGSELADLILKIRSAEKQTGPYFDNFISMADPYQRVHADINPLGTRTGRMSVSSPALQTLPKKDPVVRNAFVPSEHNVMITCDYDQIEMRLLAHFSRDPGLIAAFVNADQTGGDFFVNLANQIYQTDDVQKKNDPRRDLTKNTAYGKAYGAGVEKMAETAGVLFEVMDQVNERFNANFPMVKSFQKEVGNVASQRLREYGEPYVVTPYGRLLPAERDKGYTLVNYLIQCHAAEIFKRSIVEMDAAGLGPYLVIPVHDEIVTDVPKDIADEVAHLIPSIMTDRDSYMVPITASADVMTDRWGSKYAA